MLTPLIIPFTNSTSLFPNLCLFEISNKSPVIPPDSPFAPLGCNPNASHLYLSSATPFLDHPGKWTNTEALIPVPKFDGQEEMNPY